MTPSVWTITARPPGPVGGTSPPFNMDLVYEVCLNYAQKFGRFAIKTLFLTGAPGLGKTFLSACIARSVSEQGFSVVYDTAGNIFSQFETRKFQRDTQGCRRPGTRPGATLTCDLLILDDLGSELTTQFVQSALYELLNTRLVGEAYRHLLQPHYGGRPPGATPPDRIRLMGVPRTPLLRR